MLMTAEPGFDGESNLAGFCNNLRGPHYAVDVRQAHHFAFSDLVFFVPELMHANPATGQTVRFEVGKLDGPETLTAERAYLLAFFDQCLRGKQEPLLAHATGPFPGMRLTVGR